MSDYLDMIELYGLYSQEANWFLNSHKDNKEFIELAVTIQLLKEFNNYKATHELVKEIPKITVSDDF